MSEKEDQQEQHISVAVPAMSELLTEGQRRTLGTVLRRLEWAVWQMEEVLMQDDPPDVALTQVTHLPDPLQQDALFRLARGIRQEVSSLASDYGIVAQEEHQLRTLHALFTLLWADLEDVRPERLRAYGTVHPQLHERLGPGIQRLIDLTLAIAGVVNGTRDLRGARSLAEEGNDGGRQNDVQATGEQRDEAPSLVEKEEHS